MKKIYYLTFITLSIVILGACAKATPQSSDEMINPGDKVGDFLITTGDNESVTFLANIHCPLDQSTGIKSCELPVGTKLNVSSSIYDDDPNSGETLDESWSGSTFEMLIGGRPVNLQAFGSIDITHSMLGKMRQWNVVIVTDKPGKIAVKNSVVVDGESFEFNFIMNFIAP